MIYFLIQNTFSGKVYFWARVIDGKWTIEREELEVNKQPNRKLVIVGAKEENEAE